MAASVTAAAVFHCDDFDLSLTESDAAAQPHLDLDRPSNLTKLSVSEEAELKVYLRSDDDSDLTPLSDDEDPLSQSLAPFQSPAPSQSPILSQPTLTFQPSSQSAPPSQSPITPSLPAESEAESEADYSERRRNRNKLRRKARPRKPRQPGTAAHTKQSEKIIAKHRARAEVIDADVNMANIRTSKPGFIGLNKGPEPDINWKFIPRKESSPVTVLADKQGRVFAIRAQGPTGTQSPEDFAQGLLRAMKRLGRSAKNSNAAAPARGHYKTVSLGISFGSGQDDPSVLKDIVDEEAVREYTEDEYVRACVHHLKHIFQTWAPDLLEYYEDKMSIMEKHQGLKRLFPGLPFMSTTLNLGPYTVTNRHKDFKNLVFGLCAIVALGNFDHTKGGRLRLEEAGVEFEFAPGDMILIPSASITHYNTPIGPGETRSSLTFYTSGQMFKWVHDDCRRVNQLTVEEQKKSIIKGREICRKAWNELYSKV